MVQKEIIKLPYQTHPTLRSGEDKVEGTPSMYGS